MHRPHHLSALPATRRVTLPPLSALALFAGLAFGSGAMAQTNPLSAQIPTATIGQTTITGSTQLEGVVQPVKQSTVSAQATGRIAVFAVKAGDKVRAGQLLATIDDREALVAQRRSQAQTDQADADLRNARAQLGRTQELRAQGFVSQAALDTAATQHQSAKAQRDQATASQRQNALAQGYTRVTAPFDAWVLQTEAQAGDLAVPGKPLLILYAPLPLRVVVQVPASRLAQLGESAVVQVQSAAPDGAWITPSARTLVPAADPVSQTSEWRLELPVKASEGMVPGQQVRVRLSGSGAASTNAQLTAPNAAIVRRGELTAVYVQSGKTYSLRAIRVGQAAGRDSTEVLAGLRAGDVVALDPVRASQPNAQP
ncbi:MAG: efflux RND transporter periplasmic adaptor subunit [Rhodoferax sp.]|nr:efflux RND transporter periplasmic adaptor subunit [Rhodoferax sp.]